MMNFLRPAQIRQDVFVDYLFTTFNPAAAYRAAGFKGRNVLKCVDNYMRKPEVQAAIRLRQAQLRKSLDITKPKVLQELAKIAYANPHDFLDESGHINPLKNIPRATAAAIKEVKVNSDGSYEYKLHSKNDALDKIGRHLGLYEIDNLQKKQEWRFEDILLAIKDLLQPGDQAQRSIYNDRDVPALPDPGKQIIEMEREAAEQKMEVQENGSFKVKGFEKVCVRQEVEAWKEDKRRS